jgi:hypothetical protein
VDGSSADPCKDDYRGTGPFSEPETKAIKHFIESNPRIKSAMNFHAWGDLFIYPNSYDPDASNKLLRLQKPKFFRIYQEFEQNAPKLKKAIFGNAQKSVSYDSNGDSSDWMLYAHDIVALNPEVGNDTPYGDTFYIADTKKNLPMVVRDFHPTVKYFMEMHRTRLTLASQQKSKNWLKIEFVNKGLASLYGAKFELKLSSDSGKVFQIGSVGLEMKDAERKVSMKKDKSSSHKMNLLSNNNIWGMRGDLRRRFHLNFLVKSSKQLPENVRWELVVRNNVGLEMAKIQGTTGKKRIRRNLQRAH